MSGGTARSTPVADPPDLAELKRRHRAMWTAGDFSRIAELTLAAGTELVERLRVRPGTEVLDVATGTGNAAIPAAAIGAHVTGLDIAPDLLERGRERAANRALKVEWIEGDAEDLPFADGRFDYVLSTFGVQFAPRHEVAARELARVCAPGGMIGLASWTPHAPPARVLALIASYLPPPGYAALPRWWGVEADVRRLFAGTGVELEFDRATLYFEHDGSTDDFVDFYETYFGPLVVARERLSENGRWNRVRDAVVEIWESANETHAVGEFRAAGEYLVVLGRKRTSP